MCRSRLWPELGTLFLEFFDLVYEKEDFFNGVIESPAFSQPSPRMLDFLENTPQGLGLHPGLLW